MFSAIPQAFPRGRVESAKPSGIQRGVMADNQEDRIAALEAKVYELDTLVNLALRLIALEKPVSALLERFGATDVQNRAVHTFLDDVARRAEQGGMYAPSFAGFVNDLVERLPGARGDRQFISLLLDMLKLDRPAYKRLHEYASAQGWPQWT